MSSLAFKAPATLDDLVACLGEAGPATYLLGGGTDLIIRIRDKGITQGTLIDLTGIKGLDAIDQDRESITIGANVTYSGLCASPVIAASLPCLAQMAAQIGSVQIRNMARLPGNIANASPAGDAIATLMALDARVHTLNGKGVLKIRKIHDVVTGIGQTTLNRDEAIIKVEIPTPGPGQRSRYGKIGMGARSQVVIANVSLTMVLDYPPGLRRITGARIVLGSAAPLAFHATTAEALVQDRRPSPELAGELAETLRAEVAASIKGIAMFQHKLNDVQGLALDLFNHLFRDEFQGSRIVR
jgi:CO/xanthine dehydrogenase FAD-binding subunit